MDKSTSFRPFSVNQLKTWSRCKKKYFLDYVNKLHWPTDSKNFQLGQDVHKLLDYHSRQLDCTGIVASARQDVKSAWKLLMDDPIVHLPVLGNEWGFEVPMRDNHWLIGRVDRISKDGDNILVIDWKTGTAVPKNPEDDWQTRVYLYSVYEAQKDLKLKDFGLQAKLSPEAFRFVYVEVKDQIRSIPVLYTAERHEETRLLLDKTIGQIMNEIEYPLPETCPDKYCPYLNICGINEIKKIKNNALN